ncbi:MAG: 2-oxoglutarate dehydrogenase complex dihydrolipoyllysine-residue succinyltransferase [Micavibrio aeruginosavorus]|uniref:Dihydrolipoyllysine-residue succinyltransferase component of 2-oxoglutarate dehydrogenase complex n=1 Tax=Micavibrio aeruginosavorus TaxID=349221 RepID=A0A7T5UH82_9BACT|nr:MAG: 2-oxoglutarate dehydrogenase complex dihydrolipoyllysine-residue succinyltransferase [Micavibrio aeruginosavorus]
MTNIVVPTLGESVTEATVARWLKKEGDTISADEPVVELETDKVTLEVNAPAGGVITKIIAGEGSNVGVGALLGEIAVGSAANDAAKPKPAIAASATAPVVAAPASEQKLSPAVQKMVGDHNLDASKIPGTGKDGRILKEDVQNFVGASAAPRAAPLPAAQSAPRATGPREERVRMTRLRQRVAQRLKEAQNTAAMLTTFNEVDMGTVMDLRNAYKDTFEKKHGVKLGFMSFFAKAAVQALKEFPAVNAEIDGEDIVYKNFYDISMAMSTPQGLIVPVIRDCDTKSMAQIEKDIIDLGNRAREGRISIEEMTGGTFTITNGGVFGSLMSTPIINPPQSGILGMHKIQQRPMVMKDGKIEARPMMYIALSYDHRIIDGREAVSFLVRIKEAIEDPQRLLLDL